MKRTFGVSMPRYVGAFLSWAVTFALVSLGFILFRANNLTQAWYMFKAVLTPADYARFAMPRSFYILISTIAIAYFAWTAGHSVLLSWRAAYNKALTEPEEALQPALPTRLASAFKFAAGASVDFLSVKLWWWLAPALCVIAFWVTLVIRTQSSAIAVTPFVYALF